MLDEVTFLPPDLIFKKKLMKKSKHMMFEKHVRWPRQVSREMF